MGFREKRLCCQQGEENGVVGFVNQLSDFNTYDELNADFEVAQNLYSDD